MSSGFIYKAKTGVSTFLAKILVRRGLSRAAVKSFLPFVAVPVSCDSFHHARRLISTSGGCRYKCFGTGTRLARYRADSQVGSSSKNSNTILSRLFFGRVWLPRDLCKHVKRSLDSSRYKPACTRLRRAMEAKAGSLTTFERWYCAVLPASLLSARRCTQIFTTSYLFAIECGASARLPMKDAASRPPCSGN